MSRSTRGGLARAVAEAVLVYSVLALLLVAGYYAYAILAGNVDVRRVVTTSMEPDFPLGSVVVVKRVAPDEVEVGDVVLYSYPLAPRYALLHRVVSTSEGQVVVKGDAVPNPELVPYENIRGVYVFGVPYAGLLGDVLLLDTLLTYVALLVVVALLVLEEVG